MSKSEKIEKNKKSVSYILFSKSGFTDDIEEYAVKNSNIYLFDLEKIAEILK